MDYIVTKSTKSIGIAILLTLLFGPIGLFYASVTGGLIMTFAPIALGITFFVGALKDLSILMGFSLITLVMFAILSWLICIIWAAVAVTNYNRKLLSNPIAYPPDKNYSNDEINTKLESVTLEFSEWKKSNPNKSINDYYKTHKISNSITTPNPSKQYQSTNSSNNSIFQLIIISSLLMLFGYLAYDKDTKTFHFENIINKISPQQEENISDKN